MTHFSAILGGGARDARTARCTAPPRRRGGPRRGRDGNPATFTWTTESNNTVAPAYLAIGFAQTEVSRLRILKRPDGGGGQNVKNLVIQYTTGAGALSSRSWSNVTNLRNGLNGTELLTASAVNADGTVTRDVHTAGFASLTFDAVQATGLRIGFSNPSSEGTCSVNPTGPCNHDRVAEFEAHSESATCAGRAPTIVADPAAPLGAVFGTDGDDVILGTEGADVILGRGGRDLICGEGGPDRLAGNAGIDRVFGGEGDDRLLGGDDRARDTLDGEGDDDRLVGGPGNDALIGRDGDDDLIGGDGYDRLFYHSGADLLDGGAGRGIADFENASARIVLNLASGRGNNGVRIRAIDDVIGTRFNDVIDGSPRGNTIHGLKGNDRLFGPGERDDLFGESDDDVLFGGRGFDMLHGGANNDECNQGERLKLCEQVRVR